MDRQVTEALISAVQDLFRHEGRCEHPVAAFASDIFVPVLCQEQFPTQQADAPRTSGNPSDEHRTVLVAVAGEEMREKSIGQRDRY
jgi:hypothetical protein